MSYQNWRPVTTAEDYFRQNEKRMMHQERRPQIRKASDLLGPGFGPRAVAINDWNSDEASFNGFFFDGGAGANAPDDGAWIGQTISTGPEEGLQRVWSDDHDDLSAPIVEYRRRFAGQAGLREYGAWQQA